MVRYLDHKKRQDEIFDLLIQAYVNDGKPVSSEYLREKYSLPFSSATLRNIMSELEDLGYLSHLHTSSGRVPTQEGFRYYVDFLMRQDARQEEDFSTFMDTEVIGRLDDLLQEASKLISNLTHYAGLGIIHEKRDKIYFWGTHFMLNEPEFEDIAILRNIFTAFEERISSLGEFLDANITEGTRIFIGEEMGLEEMNNCSLVFSYLESNLNKKAFLGVLGPVRMNYSFAISRLSALKDYLEKDFLFRI